MEPPFTQPMPTPHVDAITAVAPVLSPRRPSAGWLRNPAWIDGGINPPHFYHSHEEIEAACLAAGVIPPPRYEELQKTASLTEFTQDFNERLAATMVVPIAAQYDVLSSRVSPSPIPSQHYREVVGRGEIPPLGPGPLGHLVNITHVFTPTEPQPGGALNRNMKAAPKKKKTTLLGHIELEAITRVEFIKAFLTIHSLHAHFAPGVHSGPEFRLSWTGSAGGKGGAPTILTNQSFNIALAAILLKDKGKIQVAVEFDSDSMTGFRIQQPTALQAVAANKDGDEELVYGTRIPQIANFDDALQVNGRFVMELKKKWPCATHLGEHGESGHCYLTPNGEHLRLNPLRLKMWAAAIASGDVTKHEPPNIEAFDGPRDGRSSSVRSHHRPIAKATVAAAPAPIVPTNPGNDLMAVIVASLIPLLGGLSRKRHHSESPQGISQKRPRSESPRPSMSQIPMTPKRGPHHYFPSTPKRVRLGLNTSPKHVGISSPLHPVHSSPSAVMLPAPGFELRVCLRDFARLEGVDMTEFETPLSVEEYTPGRIPFAEDSELRAITGAPGGRIVALKVFCRNWQIQYEEKIRSGFFTLYQPE